MPESSSLVETVAAGILQAMYNSVDRMNHAIADNNDGVALAEQHLQRNLRAQFEKVTKYES